MWCLKKQTMYKSHILRIRDVYLVPISNIVEIEGHLRPSEIMMEKSL